MQGLAYANSARDGLYAFGLQRTGEVIAMGQVAELLNPRFLAIHRERRLLLVTSQPGTNREDGGAISAFVFDPQTARLQHLNTTSSWGAAPCFVAVDGPGKNALIANYVSGSVCVLPIGADCRLAAAQSASFQYHGSGFDPRRQPRPLLHSINVSPDNRFAIAVALGLDRLFVYHFEGGRMVPNQPAFFDVRPGSGPRHFTFHPNGSFVYVVNEIASTVTVLGWEAIRGNLSDIQTISTLPGDFAGENVAAEILVHPGGRFLYASNRGHDSIVIFSINEADGHLTLLDHVPAGGSLPGSFALDPTASYLFVANRKSSTLTVLRVERRGARLSDTGQSFEVPSLLCVRFA